MPRWSQGRRHGRGLKDIVSSQRSPVDVTEHVLVGLSAEPVEHELAAAQADDVLETAPAQPAL